MIEYIESKNAPAAIGPYSQAVKCNGLLYTSGQISIDPKTQEFIDGTIEEQTRIVINNLKAILKASHTTIENVIKTTIFITDMNNFSIVNRIYGEHFINNPARSTVEVSKLPKNALIEIECIAEL